MFVALGTLSLTSNAGGVFNVCVAAGNGLVACEIVT